MGINRDLAHGECQPEMELAFSLEEFQHRLQRIRARMEDNDIDVLWLMAPESLNYVSGYKCIWYQAQGPKQWPATSGIAIHKDLDDFILFDTPSEAIMCRFVTCVKDIRIFPMGGASRWHFIHYRRTEIPGLNVFWHGRNGVSQLSAQSRGQQTVPGRFRERGYECDRR